MDSTLMWPTLDREKFEALPSFSFGEVVKCKDIADWNGMFEDLLVEVEVKIKCDEQEFDNYFRREFSERPVLVVEWIGDRRFVGSSDYVFVESLAETYTLSVKIDKGHCSKHLNLSLFLATKMSEITEGSRPEGSIIAEVPLVENARMINGNWFPIVEYKGDGSILVRLEYSDLDNLNSLVSSSLYVYIDQNHPLFKKSVDKSKFNFINLFILQSIVRKAFTENVYNQLIEGESIPDYWDHASLGSILNSVVKNVCESMGLSSLVQLRDIYFQKPEIIDEIIDKIYSRTFFENGS